MATCRSCVHFNNDADYLEKSFPGWSALGSAWGSTRSDDGICELRSIYLSAEGGCAEHCARVRAATRAAREGIGM